jgi:ABC-type Fe3+-siderophore transport system permease subunit
MNLGLIIFSTVAILFLLFLAWYKLKDTEEGDLISIGLGTHVERESFKVRVTLALVICSFVFLMGLLS